MEASGAIRVGGIEDVIELWPAWKPESTQILARVGNPLVRAVRREGHRFEADSLSIGETAQVHVRGGIAAH